MIGRPERTEAEPYYFRYIDQVPGDDVLAVLASQLEEVPESLSGVSEERSLHRYGPDKWTMRQVLNHVNDCERLFGARAFWFARGFDSPLPSFDQIVSAAAAGADDVPWARHVEEFRAVRRATLSFFGNLPAGAWTRTGIASGYVFSVRALAWIAAGHTTHHVGILRDRYR
ncbi:MAG TPA: DinB family protein [Thermoanaerobaculia bacterium]|nr:DinB family protein [Thermoanaerobaculia bacterium]